MPQLKIIHTEVQTTGELVDTAYGAAVSLDGAQTFSAQCAVDVDTPSAKTFNNGAANASDTTTVADTGVCEVSDVTCVADTGAFEIGTITAIADEGVVEISQATCTADIAGSLNSTYFTFQAKNTGGGSATSYYVWYNVNGAGVDPAPGGTGIEVALATGAIDTAVATATRAAITSIAGSKVVVSGATVVVIITNRFMGSVTDIADGGAATLFVFATNQQGVASNLLNKYFTFSYLNTSGVATNYYAWINVNSEGTDPALAGKTAVAVPISASAADTAVGSALRTALAAVSLAAVTGATNQAILTASFVGNPTSIADGGAPTGFTLVATNGAVSNLNSSYFTYMTRNTGGASTNSRYVWFNVNSQGVDPAPGGTGIQVTLSAGAADTAVASALRSALAADSKVTITGATTHCIITNKYMGTATDAANGTASPGFSYSITQGVASNLLNKYLNFSRTGNTVEYYAWFNINSEGTDPAVAGRTAIAVTGVASVTANNIASAARTAIDAVTTTNIVVSGSTNHIILTNATRGTCHATANGTASPGFTVSNSPVGVASGIDTTNDTVTITAHGYTTGDKGQLTSTGTLPAGLTTSTDYFIINVDANTVGFASSLALAQAGTKIDLTDDGSDNGVDTFTPTSVGGATIILQKSNSDPTLGIWSDEGSAVTVSADANAWLEKINPTGNWMRLKYTITAGQMSVSSNIVVKGLN